MLRSPLLPSVRTARLTPSYSAVSPEAARPLTAVWTLPWSVVGASSRTALPENETTPIRTSSGTLLRNAATDERTVAIPEAPIEPLVSTTMTVVLATGEPWPLVIASTG